MRTEHAALMAMLVACGPTGDLGGNEAGADQGVRLQVGLRTTGSSTTGASSTGDTAATTSTGTSTSTSTSTWVETSDASGNPIRITAGTAVIRHIELDLPSGDSCNELRKSFTFEPPVRCESGEDKIEILGPFVVDLIGRTSEPSLSGLTVPAGTYQRVDIRFHRSSAPDEITLALAGTVDPDGAGIDFDLALGLNEDARFESPGGVPVSQSGALVAMIDADVVFGATHLGACAATLADGSGHASIDAESDCGDELEDEIEEAIKERFDLD